MLIRRILKLTCFAVTLHYSAISAASDMDPALERLSLNPSCNSDAAVSSGVICQADEAAFTRLINQWAFAFAPSGLHPARTTGLLGFDVALEGMVTRISSDSAYWKSGTQGSRGAASNDHPDSLLQLYSLKLRKGLGFGLELGANLGFMPRTHLYSFGGDVRLALIEGFRKKPLGSLPDVTLGGSTRTVLGTSQFSMTMFGFDAQISKPFIIRKAAIFSPWLAYQYLWIMGDSGLIDLSPSVNALARCQFAGDNVPGGSAPNTPSNLRDGKPICRSGDNLDFANTVRFNSAHLRRHRVLVGANYRYEALNVGAGFIIDLVAPKTAQSSAANRAALEGEPRQWSFILDLGTAF